MKKFLLIVCFLLSFQMQADAVIVDPYLAPVPNYYGSASAIDFAINVGTPYYPYCDPYYPYYCRRPYYSTGVYVSPYWNIGIGFGGIYRPHYRHHVPAYRPHHIPPSPPRNHVAPPTRIHSGGHPSVHHGAPHSNIHHSHGAHGGARSSGGHGRH